MSIKLSKTATDLIDGKNLGHIATVMSDGSPQVTPVWIDRDGDIILVNTAVGRVKQKNLERDKRAAIDIVDQKNPFKMTTIRGIITQVQEGAEGHIDKLAKKYLDMDKYPWRQRGERRIILKLKPEKETTM
jgi:PPOX class probable F420-dependent enzyme